MLTHDFVARVTMKARDKAGSWPKLSEATGIPRTTLHSWTTGIEPGVIEFSRVADYVSEVAFLGPMDALERQPAPSSALLQDSAPPTKRKPQYLSIRVKLQDGRANVESCEVA